MKRFSLYARLLYSVIFLVTIAFVLLSPEEDALHFNNGLMAGKESRVNLFYLSISYFNSWRSGNSLVKMVL